MYAECENNNKKILSLAKASAKYAIKLPTQLKGQKYGGQVQLNSCSYASLPLNILV